jgi:hypothetical protein
MLKKPSSYSFVLEKTAMFAACVTLLVLLLGCPAGSPAGSPVALSKAMATIVVGGSYQLAAVPIQSVTWTTSNGAVATVSPAGLVTGMAQGIASITATANGASASCVVTVASVYIAGCVWDMTGPGRYPVYWKDGTICPLGSNSDCFGWMIAVSGTAVYVAGMKVSDSSPVWWNNGAWQLLGALPAHTSWWYTGMAISGTNVYIVGNYHTGSVDMPGYWLNGTWTPCAGAITDGQNNGVVCSGGHVYMAGTDKSASPGPQVPVYWLDGVRHVLPEGTDSNGAPNWWGWIGTAGPNIIAAESGVYILGLTHGSTVSTSVPILWKDAQINFLKSSGSHIVNSAAIHGTDTYIAGIIDNGSTNPCTPVYWKNGSQYTLPYGGSQATANFIAATDSHIYATGQPTYPWNVADPCTPLFWKDGVLTSLPYFDTDTNAEIHRMFSVGEDIIIIGTTGTGVSSGSLNYSNVIHPVCWRNGVLQPLSTGTYASGEIGYSWSSCCVALP